MAKKITLKEIGDMLTHVVKHMGTKEDISEVNARLVKVQDQVNSIEQQLRLGRYETRIGNLESKVFGAAQR